MDKKESGKTVTMRVDIELYKKLKEMAEREKRSISSACRFIIHEYFEDK